MIVKQNEPSDFPLLPKIINSGIAAIIGVSCIYPIDLVKTRLQSQTIGLNGQKIYISMFDCFSKIYKTEGIFGFYKGLSTNAILITPEKIIQLAANDFFRHKLKTSENNLPLARQALAAALAACFQIIVSTPRDFLKVQMQDSGRVAAEARIVGKIVQERTVKHLISNLIRHRGVLGFYDAIIPTLTSAVSFNMVYFPIFAVLNDRGPRKTDGSGEAVFWWSFLSGLTAGTVTSLSVNPLDVIKTRLQGVSKGSAQPKYTGFIDTFRKTLNNEGPLAFYKGGACRIMVVAPLFGILQAVYYFGVAEWLLGIKHYKTV